MSDRVQHRTLCRGRRILDAAGMQDWHCEWTACPILYPDAPCPWRLDDDDRSLPPLGMGQVVVDEVAQ